MKKLETSANLCTIYIQCVPRLIKQTSWECSLCWTIPI
jgi:hypothetical protein